MGKLFQFKLKGSNTSNRSDIRSIWTNPLHFLAAGLGSGAMPFAPGTFGSLMAFPFYFLLIKFSLTTYAIVVLLVFIAGCYLADNAGKAFKQVDHPAIVIDEMVGMWIVLFATPIHIYWQIAAFVLFRLFDITKPFPINWLEEKFNNGFGVMIDDVMAALYAVACLLAVEYLLLKITF